MSIPALKGKAQPVSLHIYMYYLIRVHVTLLHQLTTFIIKLSVLQSENPLNENRKKTNTRELIQWLRGFSSTSHYLPVRTLFLYQITRLDFDPQ